MRERERESSEKKLAIACTALSILSVSVYYALNVITFHFQFFVLLRVHFRRDGVGEGGICRHDFFLDRLLLTGFRWIHHGTSAACPTIDTLGVFSVMHNVDNHRANKAPSQNAER